MTFENILLHLSLIPQVGPATIEKLISALEKDQLLNIYSFTKNDFTAIGQLQQSVAIRITQGLLDKKLLDEELGLIDKHNIKLLTVYNSEYPQLLKNIYLPPAVLYIKGNLDINNDRMISIVGSRKPDKYGYNVVNKLVPELVEHNWVLVSGGALGIDTIVHKSVLGNKGSTIAVLGSGLLCPYPATNKDLFTEISKFQGAVISSFPLRMSALAGNFPARNRIIAGLSKGCVVVQAANQSGALITARYALEQGREVFAVPGAIDNILSAGCHKLISEGATLVTCANDIRLGLRDANVAVNKQEERQLSINLQSNMQNNLEIKPVVLPETPKELILFLAKNPVSFDDILAQSNLTPSQLQEILWSLAIDGLVEQNFMGLWQKI